MGITTNVKHPSSNSSISRPKKLLFILSSLVGFISVAHIADFFITYPEQEMHKIVDMDYEKRKSVV